MSNKLPDVFGVLKGRISDKAPEILRVYLHIELLAKVSYKEDLGIVNTRVSSTWGGVDKEFPCYRFADETLWACDNKGSSVKADAEKFILKFRKDIDEAILRQKPYKPIMVGVDSLIDEEIKKVNF